MEPVRNVFERRVIARRLLLTQAIVNKLLHNPTVFLKSRPSPAKLALAKEIFGLADVESCPETGEEPYQEGEG